MFIEKYYLSRRVKNILINNFSSIEDFCNASQEQLLKLNNSGISSVREMVRVQEKLKKTNIQNLEKEILNKLQDTIQSENPSNFKELLMRSIKVGKIERNRPIILKRLSGEITLQEAADQWTPAITKERIRQIEAKILRRLSKYKDIIVDELNSCKVNSTRVMYLWELGIQNPFFEGLNEYISTGKSTLLSKIILSDYKCKFELDDISNSSMSLKPKDSPNYKEVLLRLERLEVADHDISNYLIAFKRPDLLSKIEDIKASLIPKSKHKRAVKFLKEIFKNAVKPLQNKELQKKLREEYSLDLPENIIGNARQTIDGLYRFTDRGWGYEYKFRKLDSNQLEEIQSFLLNHLKKFSPKQFSCKELLEEIKKEKGFSPNLLNKVNKLTGSDIDWALQKIDYKFNDLNQLGRKTWSWNQEKGNRLNTMQLAINALESFGGPMKTSEIKQYIEQERSTGNFQLRTTRANPDLIQVSKDKWGLRWRDINLSKHEEELLLKNILQEFKRGNSVLSSADIKKILEMLDVDKSVTPWHVSRVMLRYVASNTERSGDHFKIKLPRKISDKNFQIIDIHSDIDPASVQYD